MIEIIEAASSRDLLTLDEAKVLLPGLGLADAALQLEISFASEILQAKVGRPLVAEKVREVFRFRQASFGITLARWPVISVEVADFGGTLWDFTRYQLDKSSGRARALYAGAPTGFRPGVFSLTYTAGFQPIPAFLKKACSLLVKDSVDWSGRESGIKSSRLEGVAAESYSERSKEALPPHVAALVQHLKDAGYAAG